jgi:hypothetical protein
MKSIGKLEKPVAFERQHRPESYDDLIWFRAMTHVRKGEFIFFLSKLTDGLLNQVIATVIKIKIYLIYPNCRRAEKNCPVKLSD